MKKTKKDRLWLIGIIIYKYIKYYLKEQKDNILTIYLNRHKELKHLTVYGLRHFFATHCKELGMEAEVVAKLMGHTEYETTQKYYIHVLKNVK